jgi:hypothetical protein
MEAGIYTNFKEFYNWWNTHSFKVRYVSFANASIYIRVESKLRISKLQAGLNLLKILHSKIVKYIGPNTHTIPIFLGF